MSHQQISIGAEDRRTSAGGASPRPPQLSAIWDEVAATYSEDAQQWAHYTMAALRHLRVGAADRVIDIGCGPGTLAFLAAARVAHVTALDFSTKMIEALQMRATREKVANIEGAVMDAEALDLPDGSFDAAFCMFACSFFSNRAQALQEMRRVLRPGGRALISTWGPLDRRPLMGLGFEAFEEALPQWPRQAQAALQSPEECVRELSAAGFRDVTTHLVTASVHFQSADQYLDRIVRAAAPCALMRKKLGSEAFRTMMEPVVRVLERRIPEGGVELGAEAILTIGTR